MEINGGKSIHIVIGISLVSTLHFKMVLNKLWLEIFNFVFYQYIGDF